MQFHDADGDVVSPLDWSVDQVRQWAAQFVGAESAGSIRANGFQLCCLLPTCPGCESIPALDMEAVRQCEGADETRLRLALPDAISQFYFDTYVKTGDAAHLRAWAVLVAGCSETVADSLTVTPKQLGVLAGLAEPEDEDAAPPPLPACVSAAAREKRFRITSQTVAGWASGATVRYWALHVLLLGEDDATKLAAWPEGSGLPWAAFVGADMDQLTQLRLSPDALRILDSVLCRGLLDWPAKSSIM